MVSKGNHPQMAFVVVVVLVEVDPWPMFIIQGRVMPSFLRSKALIQVSE